MSDLLSDLNPQQREAVLAVEGPLLILAGAGSGKTRVITYRIAHLMTAKRVPGRHLLAVTFTNKAAAEMRSRVAQLAAAAAELPPIATFHSFCVQLLRRDYPLIGGRRDFVIYDADDQEKLLKSVYRRLGYDEKRQPVRALLGRISAAKNRGLGPEAVAQAALGRPGDEALAALFQEYQRELRRANALDFDDLLLEAERLLRESEACAARCGATYRYLLVDEYQDTNRPQYLLLRQLTRAHQNLCVVGDEDQSIYSWRGADLRNILDFERDFPGARVLRLEQNYRSTGNILAAASALVENNRHRKGKRLWTEAAKGEPLDFYRAADGEQEALYVAGTLRAWLSRHPDRPAAVLYRINAQSRAFEEALRRYNLPYRLLGGFSFYERAEIKDLLAYLKLALNPDDSVSLLRVINTPPRGLGRASVEALEARARRQGRSLWQALSEQVSAPEPGRASAGLKQFHDLMLELRRFAGTARLAGDAAEPEPGEGADASFDPAQFETQPAAEAAAPASDSPVAAAKGEEPGAIGLEAPAGAASAAAAPPYPLRDMLELLLERTGYANRLRDEETTEAQARLENIDELLAAAAEADERGERLGDFLDHAALISEQDGLDRSIPVTLMTLHAAKGLEFPLVFLVGLEEGLLPHARAVNALSAGEPGGMRLEADELEEERRLCYVGMTRARERLVVTCARLRRRFGAGMPMPQPPSRFLSELPRELLRDLSPPGGGELAAGSYAGRRYVRDGYEQAEWKEPAASPGWRPPASAPAPAPAAAAGWRPGMRVRHARYGAGTILKVEGVDDQARLTISFPGYGQKKFMEKYASLERA